MDLFTLDASAPAGWVSVETTAEMHGRFAMDRPESTAAMTLAPVPVSVGAIPKNTRSDFEAASWCEHEYGNWMDRCNRFDA